MNTAVVMFQRNVNEDVFFHELREICVRASNDGWNVVHLDAHYIDIPAILDKMERDHRERINALIDEAEAD